MSRYSSSSGSSGPIAFVVIIVAVISLIVSLKSCQSPVASPTYDAYGNDITDTSTSEQFIKIKDLAPNTYLVYDKDTKAEYIWSRAYVDGYLVNSFCPYYGKDNQIQYY